MFAAPLSVRPGVTAESEKAIAVVTPNVGILSRQAIIAGKLCRGLPSSRCILFLLGRHSITARRVESNAATQLQDCLLTHTPGDLIHLTNQLGDLPPQSLV